MDYPQLDTQAYEELSDRKRQNAFWYWQGYREGEVDSIFEGHGTIEERAHRSWINRTIYYTHEKQYVRGYLDGAESQRS